MDISEIEMKEIRVEASRIVEEWWREYELGNRNVSLGGGVGCIPAQVEARLPDDSNTPPTPTQGSGAANEVSKPPAA